MIKLSGYTKREVNTKIARMLGYESCATKTFDDSGICIKESYCWIYPDKSESDYLPDFLSMIESGLQDTYSIDFHSQILDWDDCVYSRWENKV